VVDDDDTHEGYHAGCYLLDQELERRMPGLDLEIFWDWDWVVMGKQRGCPCRDRALGRSPDWQDFVQVVGHAGVSGIAGLALGLDMITVCYIRVRFSGEDIWIVEVED
jgi:hypothetical protein